jgi:phosphoglycerate dehydrogenase-like enzyme
MGRVAMWPSLRETLQAEALRAKPPELTLTWVSADASDDELINRLEAADYLMGFVRREPSARVYAQMGVLRLVQLLSAGYEKLDIASLRKYRVLVAGNGGANAIAVAEHTVMLMLAVLKSLTAFDAGVRAGHPAGLDLLELSGKTVGLVGMGHIGQEVARRVRAFGARLLYYDLLRLPEAIEKDLGAIFVSFDTLVSNADILSLHAPLTNQTRGLVDRRVFEIMKSGAVLINTSRGGLVDETALADAIRSGRLRGAGLDVFTKEPPPPDHPLLALGPRVIATPHVAGPTRESWPRRFANGFSNIMRMEQGLPPLWIIPELRDSEAPS